MNCLHSFRTRNKLESQEKVCKTKNEDTKILEFNQYEKSDKAPFIIYVDLECIIEKIDECKNIPENSSTIKVSKHILSGFLMCTISSFRSIENKHDVYIGKDYMKKFCESLREYTMKIINFKDRSNKRTAGIIWKCKKYVIFGKNKFENKYLKNKKYRKFRDHYHYTGKCSIYNNKT